MHAWLLRTGALSGALAVALGAYGAHGIQNKVTPQRHKAWETAAHYQLVHAAMQCLCAALPKPSTRAGYLFLAGTTLFSGSIYALVLLDKGALGAITPIGGLLMIAGWAQLAVDYM